jgi:sirohydrochlorin ferrochelatase
VIAVHGIRGQAGCAVEHAKRITGDGQFAGNGRLDSRGPFDDVRVACLKGTPSLPEVFADLDGRDVILTPLLMADGYTLKAMRRQLAPLTPTLRSLIIAPPLGVHPRLAELIVTIATDTCRARGWPLAETDLLIAAHGTRRDPNSGKSAFDHVEAIRAKNIFAAVRTGFLDQPPMLADVTAASRACHHVAVGLFIDCGEHGEEDIPEILNEVDPEAIYTGPIGADPRVTDLLLDQTEDALAKQSVTFRP